MMRPVSLKFYGNHTLDFADYSREDLAQHITMEMRNLEIPDFDDIMLTEYDHLRAEVPPEMVQKFITLNCWKPLTFKKFPGFHGEMPNIVLRGPMGLILWFTPYHIEFTSPIMEREGWYAPENRQTVKLWRGYFYTIITRFGGDRAIYITERQSDKFYNQPDETPEKAFSELAAALTARYGENKKSLFDFSNGKFPRYYIDDFSDLKANSL